MLRAVALTVVALLVAACAAGGGAVGSDAAASSASMRTASGEPGTSGLPASITDPIVADAAARQGVDPAAVSIVEARPETFSDGSLGCPEPGMMYTQALVDGYRVIIEASGTRLDYRGSGPGQFRICENP